MDAATKGSIKETVSRRKAYAWFTSGVFSAQLAGNALHVLLPIWVLTLVQKSASTLAILLFAFALLDTLGTVVGGWLLRSVRCGRMVFLASLFRFIAATLFAALYSYGALTEGLWFWLCGLFAVDSLAKGIADTGRFTMPLELVANPKTQLKKANGILQSFFELGAVIGPVMVGVLFAFGQAESAAWLLAFLFACSSGLFFAMTKNLGSEQPIAVEAEHQMKQEAQVGGPIELKLKQPSSSPIGLRVLLGLQGLLTVYPIRALLPAIFAVQIFESAPLTAWFVAAFGLGGFFGSRFYTWLGQKLELRYLVQLAGIAVGLLTCLLLTKSVYLHFFGYFLFMFFNTIARLGVLSEVQLVSTSAIAQLRFVANSTSMLIKIGLGALLAIPGGLFWSTGLLALCGGMQILGSYFTEENSMKDPSKERLLWLK